jgi:hypothetical protein
MLYITISIGYSIVEIYSIFKPLYNCLIRINHWFSLWLSHNNLNAIRPHYTSFVTGGAALTGSFGILNNAYSAVTEVGNSHIKLAPVYNEYLFYPTPNNFNYI